MMYKIISRVALLAVIFSVTACASLLPDHTVTITEAQVQQKLNEKLAVPLTLMKLFDVHFTNPVVRFDGATERMHAQLDANVKSVLGSPFSGKAAISGKLKFDPVSNSVFLVEPKIERLNLGDAAGKYGDLISVLATTLGGELLKDLPLYTIKPESLKVAGVQYQAKTLKVGNQGLQIMLSPK